MSPKGLIFMKNEWKKVSFVKTDSKISHFHEKMNQKGRIFVKNDSKRSHFHEKKLTKNVSFAIVVATN